MRAPPAGLCKRVEGNRLVFVRRILKGGFVRCELIGAPAVCGDGLFFFMGGVVKTNGGRIIDHGGQFVWQVIGTCCGRCAARNLRAVKAKTVLRRGECVFFFGSACHTVQRDIRKVGNTSGAGGIGAHDHCIGHHAIMTRGAEVVIDDEIIGDVGLSAVKAGIGNLG